MSGPELSDAAIALGGGLVAAFLSGRQYSYSQLAGQPQPKISRGAIVAIASAALAVSGIGGDSVSEPATYFALGSGAAELGKMAYQKGAAGVGPNVSGRQGTNLIDDMMQRVRSLIAPQQRYNGGAAQFAPQHSNAL